MKKGFTLIELLVVITIIGLLGSISAASFSNYFKKARDTVRITAVDEMSRTILADGATNWQSNRFFHTPTELDALFLEVDFRMPRIKNDICYLYGIGEGASGSGSDNQYFVASFGEATSTANQTESGVIVSGTGAATAKIQETATPLQIADFACNGDFSAIKTKMDATLGSNPTYYFWDGTGIWKPVP